MTLTRWLPTFLAFPPGGLLAIEAVGSLDGPLSAAAGGLLAGAVIGFGQWLALRADGIGLLWAAVTALALAAGNALASVLTGAGTDVGDLVLTGLVAGAAVGAAQSALLARGLAARAALLASGRVVAAAWTAVTAASWSLGWLVTSAVIVDADRGHHVFGASGALVATLVCGLALRALLAPAATRATAAA